MAKMREGHWYKFNDRGEVHVGYYVGNDCGFPCCVCDKGKKAHVFNIWHDLIGYESWGYGREHMPEILEDLGEVPGVIIDKVVE